MTPLEERNLVWNLVELVILKHGFKIDSEFLDPVAEDEIVFGNFFSGHPMSFEAELPEFVAEISRKLPSDYIICKDYILDTGSAIIGITKI
jgi:hypothetical protein